MTEGKLWGLGVPSSGLREPSATDEVLGRGVYSTLGLCMLGRMLYSRTMPGPSPNCRLIGRLACSALLSTLSRQVDPEGLTRHLGERHSANHQVVPEGLTLGQQVGP